MNSLFSSSLNKENSKAASTPARGARAKDFASGSKGPRTFGANLTNNGRGGASQRSARKAAAGGPSARAALSAAPSKPKAAKVRAKFKNLQKSLRF